MTGIPDPRELHFVGGVRHQIGPSYVVDVLTFSDEKPVKGAPYPTGDFTTFVSGEETWHCLEWGVDVAAHNNATDDDMAIDDYLGQVAYIKFGEV